MPDVPGIFQHGAITGEFTNPRHIEDRLPGPCRGMLISLANNMLHVDIGWQVGEMKIAVALFQKGSGNPGKQSWLMRTEEVRGESVHDALGRRRVDIIRLGVITAMGTQFPNLLGFQAKNKNILLPDFLLDLDVGSIEGAYSQGAIHRKFHVTRARGLGAGSRDMFAKIRSGDDLFS